MIVIASQNHDNSRHNDDRIFTSFGVLLSLVGVEVALPPEGRRLSLRR
jgi:hypothetical protein